MAKSKITPAHATAVATTNRLGAAALSVNEAALPHEEWVAENPLSKAVRSDFEELGGAAADGQFQSVVGGGAPEIIRRRRRRRTSSGRVGAGHLDRRRGGSSTCCGCECARVLLFVGSVGDERSRASSARARASSGGGRGWARGWGACVGRFPNASCRGGPIWLFGGVILTTKSEGTRSHRRGPRSRNLSTCCPTAPLEPPSPDGSHLNFGPVEPPPRQRDQDLYEAIHWSPDYFLIFDYETPFGQVVRKASSGS